MPDDTDAAVHAAELLLRGGRIEDAAELLRAAVGRDPGDARVLRVLSAVEMMLDRLDAALIAIDRALTIMPGVAEYHLHRGHLLHRLGDIAAAGEAFDRAAALEPDSPGVRRAQMTLYLDSGRITEATAVGIALLHVCPGDEPAAEAALPLLNRRTAAMARHLR